MHLKTENELKSILDSIYGGAGGLEVAAEWGWSTKYEANES